MEEYLHFDDPCNGGLHFIVPEKLVAFDCPTDLPKDPDTGDAQEWMDVNRERAFDPAFFADLFLELDVDLVVQCCGEYTALVFEAYNIPSEQININDISLGQMLLQFYQFVILMRAVPCAC